MFESSGHEWVEVIPPRIFGGDTIPKMAVHCRRCGRQIITSEADAKYTLDYPCPGPPAEAPANGGSNANS
jgi:hypothetical protein